MRGTLLFIVAALTACTSGGPESSDATGKYDVAGTLHEFDFSQGIDHAFIPIFRDIPKEIFLEYERRKNAPESLGPVAPDPPYLSYPEEHSHWLLNSGLFPLPDGLPGQGFLLQGNNHSDDLDMHLAKRLGPADGINPNRRYMLWVTVDLAGNAPSGAIGVGGAPDIGLNAQVTTVDPTAYVISEDGHVRHPDLKGADDFSHVAGVGSNAVCWSPSPFTIVPPGGTRCPQGRIPFQLKRGRQSRAIRMASDPSGALWLLVGSHSGYESFSAIFYTKIVVKIAEEL